MNLSLSQKDASTGQLDTPDLLCKLQHLFRPNIFIYFSDFTLSAIIGNTFLVLAAFQPNGSIIQILYVVISTFALFRSSAFMHEVFHLEKRFKGSMLFYNILHGFLHKVPMYHYDTHRYHHMPRTYGTLQDPEYDNLGDRSAFYNVVFSPFILMLASPIFLILRWGIIPFLLPFIGEKRRTIIYRHFSTLVMNMRFIRPDPTEEQKKQWYVQDFFCAVYSILTLGLIYMNVLPWRILIIWVIVIYFICVMNFFRAMMNHRYVTNFQPITHKQQIIDSITYPLSPFNMLFYPVGLGYHALHHLFPQIPYHNLGKAHSLLMHELPRDHPYRVTVIRSFYHGLTQLLTKKF